MDTVEGKAPAAATPSDREGGASIDRFEVTRRFEVREEEEKVEAAQALYERAARAWMQSDALQAPEPADSEELEAISQELKLRQKCLDIAALIQADEQALLDSGSDEEEE